MGQFTQDLSISFVGSKLHYLQANANFLTSRLLKRKVFNKIVLPNSAIKKTDVLYSYGAFPLGLCVDSNNITPILTTLGFPTLKKEKEKGSKYLKECADDFMRLAADTSLVHFHTDCMREAFLLQQPDWRNKCITVPFFMPQLRFNTETAILKKFQSEETHILFVGVDGNRKGIKELCAALDYLADYLHQNKVITTLISKTIPSCQIYKNIIYHTLVGRETVQKLMQESHIYAMVPHTEHFGIVYVEAMAAGCAVIADNDVPREEIFDYGSCGVLVEAGNATSIANALKTLINDRSLAINYALKGWRRAKERYNPTNVAQQYTEAFKSLLKNKI
jgi:glycosyltransferase involved in cell wall biosynthesis